MFIYNMNPLYISLKIIQLSTLLYGLFDKLFKDLFSKTYNYSIVEEILRYRGLGKNFNACTRYKDLNIYTNKAFLL